MASAEPKVVVYEVRNAVNGHRYIGYTARGLRAREKQHCAMARQGLGHHLHRAIRVHGQENFVFEVLLDFLGDEELAKAYECEMIAKWQPEYNISLGGDGKWVSEESRKKIGDANRGRKASDETRKKLRESHLGKTASIETRRRMREANLGKRRSAEARRNMSGRVFSAETREKIAAANRGKAHSVETREKIRAVRLGTTASVETRQKISAANKGRPAANKGVPHSEETLRKMSAAHTGKVATEEARANMRAAQQRILEKPPTAKMLAARAANSTKAINARKKAVRCLDDGRVFDSAAEADRFYGCAPGSVTSVLSGRFKHTHGLHFIFHKTEND